MPAGGRTYKKTVIKTKVASSKQMPTKKGPIVKQKK